MGDNWFDKKTNRSVIIALDHGLNGVPEGLENIRDRVETIIDARPDALIVSPGLAKALRQWRLEHCPPFFVTCDFRTDTSFHGARRLGEVYRGIAAAEDAERLGAVGIKAVLMFGRENLETHADNVAFVARCARDCERAGLTMMIEPVMWGTLVPSEKQTDPSLVRHAVRLAFELGADVIKAPYTGDAASFRGIASEMPAPIVILGGPKRARAEEVFQDVQHAVQAGARGVAFGRNVFQSPEPQAVIRRLQKIVHAQNRGVPILDGEASS